MTLLRSFFPAALLLAAMLASALLPAISQASTITPAAQLSRWSAKAGTPGKADKGYFNDDNIRFPAGLDTPYRRAWND